MGPSFQGVLNPACATSGGNELSECQFRNVRPVIPNLQGVFSPTCVTCGGNELSECQRQNVRPVNHSLRGLFNPACVPVLSWDGMERVQFYLYLPCVYVYRLGTVQCYLYRLSMQGEPLPVW